MMENEPDKLPFQFRKKAIHKNLEKENWNAIEKAITEQEEPVTARLAWLRPLLAAASVIIVIGLVWYWAQYGSAPQLDAITTYYGELKNITLPDGSLVKLNANSHIRIPKNWNDKDNREVWLDGEAYFRVSKKPATHQKFIVHTSQVDIAVLGTKFNVNTRHAQSIVSLEEGRVQLSVNGVVVKELGRAKQDGLSMKPGEMAVVNDSQKVDIKEEKTITAYSGWTRNEYNFDNTPLSEIKKMIEDNYGYGMRAENDSLFNIKISGDLRAANLPDLIKVLEFACGVNMKVDHKTIYLQANN
ncbi:FecR family protein [Parafilimonas sp.]|uniref:FecR family protein n=1 Tax=Parafilimonas sp. TaxID=1969739 RepID=UPI0039E5C2E6